MTRPGAGALRFAAEPMTSPAHRIRPFQAVAALLAAALLPALAGSGPARAEILEEIAARVNDAIITRSELQIRRDQVARQLSERFQGEELETRLNAAQDALLFDMINEELLLQQAKLMFDMDKYFDNLKREFKRSNEIATDTELVEYLRKEGFTMDEFRRLLLRSNVPADTIQYEVARKISVSPAEVEAYYQAHPEEYRKASRVTLREIVILADPRGAEAARDLASRVEERLAAGEDFADLARELSESPSRERGGLTGPFTPGELAPLLEERAFGLPVGAVTEPLATSYGFHILKVESRTEASVPPLAEVSESIEQKLRQEKYSDELDAYLKKLWQTNRVAVNPRYAVGKLADGGPYVGRDAIVPAGKSMGATPPPPADPPAGGAEGE